MNIIVYYDDLVTGDLANFTSNDLNIIDGICDQFLNNLSK